MFCESQYLYSIKITTGWKPQFIHDRDAMNVPDVMIHSKEVRLDPSLAKAANNSLKNAATFQAEGGSGKGRTGAEPIFTKKISS